MYTRYKTAELACICYATAKNNHKLATEMCLEKHCSRNRSTLLQHYLLRRYEATA